MEYLLVWHRRFSFQCIHYFLFTTWELCSSIVAVSLWQCMRLERLQRAATRLVPDLCQLSYKKIEKIRSVLPWASLGLTNLHNDQFSALWPSRNRRVHPWMCKKPQTTMLLCALIFAVRLWNPWNALQALIVYARYFKRYTPDLSFFHR